MNLEQLKQFLQITKAEGVTEIDFEAKDVKISVSFVSKPQAVVHQAAPVVHHQTQVAPVATVHGSAPAHQTKADLASGHYIKSPFVGTYYGSAAPGKPKYIKIG